MNKLENLTRRQIRYICFRLMTQSEGGAKASKEKEGVMSFVDEIKEHMEDQEDFGGWDKFSKTWDVDEKSPLVAVKRISSVQTEWNKILKAETKELPQEKKLLNKLAAKVQAKKSRAHFSV